MSVQLRAHRREEAAAKHVLERGVGVGLHLAEADHGRLGVEHFVDAQREIEPLRNVEVRSGVETVT